jgi:hypothetical protein
MIAKSNGVGIKARPILFNGPKIKLPIDDKEHPPLLSLSILKSIFIPEHYSFIISSHTALILAITTSTAQHKFLHLQPNIILS